MGSPAVDARTLVTVRLLQTSCGLLAVASLVALGQPTPVIVAYDGASTVASAHPAVPTEWSRGGPLAIPTIGVVPPGSEDWFDPKAEPTFQAHPPLPTTVILTTTQAPTRETQEPVPTSPAGSSLDSLPATAPPTPTTEPPPRTGATPTTTPTTTTTTPETTAPPSTTTADPTEITSPTTPLPRTDERGNVVLAFGDELTVFDGATGAVVFAIAVESVTLDVECTAPEGTPAGDGHLVAVRVRVTTGPDLAAVGGEPAVRAADFRLLAPDGRTLADAGTADTCLPDAEGFPTGPVAPGQELSGAVVLEVPATAGTLVFAPDFLTVGAEWQYGTPAAG